MPLGILPDVVHTEQRVELEPGSMLVVYSDGLTEASDSNGEFFGEERLLALALQLRGLSAAAAGARLLDAVDRFTADRRPGDDLSLVVVRRSPAA
jgi:sigma-B regulation protein RsbU (phosphoserine phosphatase)